MCFVSFLFCEIMTGVLRIPGNGRSVWFLQQYFYYTSNPKRFKLFPITKPEDTLHDRERNKDFTPNLLIWYNQITIINGT